MAIGIKKVTDYRKIGSNLVEVYPKTVADQVVYGEGTVAGALDDLSDGNREITVQLSSSAGGDSTVNSVDISQDFTLTLPDIEFADLTNTPTTLSGYGVLDDVATTSTNGLMSSTDKTKLDGLSQYPRITSTQVGYGSVYIGAAGATISLDTSMNTCLSFSMQKGLNGQLTHAVHGGIDYQTISLCVNPSQFCGSGITVDSTGSISVPTYVGATISKAGTAGLVPAATAANRNKYLKGDGTWGEISVPKSVASVSGAVVQAEENHPEAENITVSEPTIEFDFIGSNGGTYTGDQAMLDNLPDYTLTSGTELVLGSLDLEQAAQDDFEISIQSITSIHFTSYARVTGLTYYNDDWGYDVNVEYNMPDLPAGVDISSLQVGSELTIPLEYYDETMSGSSGETNHPVLGTVSFILHRTSTYEYSVGVLWTSAADSAGGPVLRLTSTYTDSTTSTQDIDLSGLVEAASASEINPIVS